MKRAGGLGIAVALILSLAACQSREQKAASHFERANALTEAGDLEGAGEALRKAIAATDDNAAYWIALGRVELRLQHFLQAYRAYQRALELTPADMETLRILSELSLYGGQNRDAARYADQLLVQVPGDLNGRMVQATLAFREKRYEDAIVACDQILAGSPGLEPATVVKARAIFDSGRRADGIALLEAYRAANGDKAQTLEALSEFYRALPDYVRLAQIMDLRFKQGPISPALGFERTRALFAAGRAKEALASAEALQGRYPRLPRLAVGLVRLTDAAEGRPAALTQALAMGEAGGVPVKVALASEMLDLGEYEIGHRLIAPLLGGTGGPNPLARIFGGPSGEIDSVNADANAIQGQLELIDGKDAEARRRVEAVLEFDETNLRALLVRAELLMKEGQFERALTDVQMVLNNSPASFPARLLLARIYAAKGDRTLALTNYRRASTDHPTNPDVLTAHAVYLADHGRLGEALVLIRSFLRDNPRNGRARAIALNRRLCTDQEAACRTAMNTAGGPWPEIG